MITHTPVLLDRVIEFLELKPKMVVVDCTIGEGGHAYSILERIPGGVLIGIERDGELLKIAEERLKTFGEGFIPVHDSFENIKKIVDQLGFGKVDRVFFDLGVSMYHFKKSGRGFSFYSDEPLDMRLDLSSKLTAYEVVNSFSKKKLAEIIWAYGEERFSWRIADLIERERKKKPITSTLELADIIMRAIPRKFWPKNIHPATKTFQAIRIFINDEVEILEKALNDAVDMLKPGGRIVVISFHSIEDRIVKNVFRGLAKGCTCPEDFPVCVCGGKKKLRIVTRKPVVPDESEKRDNPSSRSAHLRCAVKLNGDSSGYGENINALAS